MEERTNQLAHFLKKQGVEKGDRVGVYLNRSLESVIGVYAILKAGGAFVPLDAAAPVARVKLLIEDCEIACLITGPVLRRQLKQLVSDAPACLQTVVGYEPEDTIKGYSWNTIADFPTSSPTVKLLGSDLAYIMYTSGSTGNPKGIMHTHSSGLAYAKLSADLYDLQKEDVVANHCALHYDISTFGYFSAPLVGATVFMLSDAHVKFPASLIPLLAKEKVSVWYSVPLALIQMLQSGQLVNHHLGSLRWVLTGGEPFAPAHIRALMKLWPQAIFSNVYGPAEVNQCTYYHLNQPPADDEAIPLGQLWDDTEGLIVDADDEEVVKGEIGELLVRSATMMRGYWKRPDLTEKAFYQRSRLPGFTETFYRTGDLVKINEAGELLFLGRKDRQIKTRGYRVELEEVENALNALDEVFISAVFPRRNGEEGWLIEALVVSTAGTVIDEINLNKQLKKTLPPYAIPNRIHFTESIPRTAAGKIDRKALLTKIEGQ